MKLNIRGSQILGIIAAILIFFEIPIARAEDCGGWSKLSPTNSPTGRLRHSLSYDPIRKQTVLFGGTGISNAALVVLDDTWIFNSLSKNWSQLNVALPHPSPRYGATLTFDNYRNVHILFGGADISGLTKDDTWEFDGSSWRELSPLQTPGKRVFHNATFDSRLQRKIIFGGEDEATFKNDTWAWDGATWSKAIATGPSARDLASMSYDTQRSQVVLFGGFDGASYLGDISEFDGTTWQANAATGPIARIESPLTYAQSLRKSLLFGGFDSVGNVLGDTWLWDGTRWRPLQIPGPSARRGAQSVYDSHLDGVVLFGGTNDTTEFFSDTWLFSILDSDRDGVADCSELCPLDPGKLLPGNCGCGVIDTPVCVSSADFNLSATRPAAPRFRMNKKNLRVTLQNLGDVKYILSYYEVKRRVGNRKQKPKIKKATRSSPVIEIRGLGNNRRYNFSYIVQSKSSPNSTSRVSPRKTYTVRRVLRR